VPRFFYYQRWAEIQEAYPEVYRAYLATWENYFAWHNTERDFPFNIGILDYWRNDQPKDSESDTYKTDPSDYSTGWAQFLPDFQQQAVIDAYTANIIHHNRTRIRSSSSFAAETAKSGCRTGWPYAARDAPTSTGNRWDPLRSLFTKVDPSE